jgi:tetratricopeptide (TPR) repeat protein
MTLLAGHPEVRTPECVPELIYSRFLTEHGDFEKAGEVLAGIRLRASAAFGERGPYVASIDNRIGILYLHEGRLHDAEVAFRGTLSSQDQREESYGTDKQMARLYLALVRMEQGRFREAEPVVRDMYERLMAKPAAEREKAKEFFVNHRMGQLLMGLGEPAAARLHFERALELTGHYEPSSPAVAQLRGRLAQSLIELREWQAAEAQLALAEQAFRDQPDVSGQYKRPVEEARARLRQAAVGRHRAAP